MRRAAAMYDMPASVNVSFRVVRISNRVPSISSRSATLRVSVLTGILSSRAAADRLPLSTAVSNISMASSRSNAFAHVGLGRSIVGEVASKKLERQVPADRAQCGLVESKRAVSLGNLLENEMKVFFGLRLRSVVSERYFKKTHVPGESRCMHRLSRNACKQ